MARVLLTETIYRQMNTNELNFFIQNVSGHVLYAVQSATIPDVATEGHKILPFHGIIPAHGEGLWWGRPVNGVDFEVEVTEA